jgi:SAM-dependent methyltransferase
MKLRHMLTTLKLSDPFAMFKIVGDWQRVVRWHFLHAAEQSGLLCALCEPRDKQELTALLEVQRPEILDALLDVGVAVGELGQKAGRYRLKGRRARALSEERGDPLAAVIEANLTYYNQIYRRTAERLRGGPDEDCLLAIGDVVARFSTLAEPMVRGVIEDSISVDQPLRMLDVGCGAGEYLRAVASLNDQASGVGLEIDPAVAERAAQNLAAWGIDERFEIVCGDVRSDSERLAGTFDLITLLNVVYYFVEEERTPLLRVIHGLLSPGGKLVVVNNMQDRGKDFSAANLNLAVSSMKGCTALPRRELLIEQLRTAGFERIDAKRLASKSAFWAVVAERGQ